MRFSPRSIVKGQSRLLATLMTAAQVACNQSAIQQEVTASLELTSSSFAGGTIPTKCACGGQDTSPQLSWKSAPPGTQTFALIVTDKDSRFGSLFGYFVHWLLYDLPADKRELTEGMAKQEQLPDGSRQG